LKALEHQLRIKNTSAIVVMYWNTSTNIDVGNENTSAIIIMHWNTSAKPHLWVIIT